MEAKQIPQVTLNSREYDEILQRAIAVIDQGRARTAQQVVATVSNTYWEIGKLLYEKKIESEYGSAVVRKLSVDLKGRYPKMGLSPRQLWNMRSFFVRYKDSDEKVLRAVALLPWSHNLLIMREKINDEATLYYAQESVYKGWSRDLLLNAIKLEMHTAQSLVPSSNNFYETLPAQQAKYADEVFRSSYNLGFLGITEPVLELELERRLVEKIKLFLLELGQGFTFIGNQHVLEYGGKEYRVDMLFFHRKLHCLVAIDLKIGEFRPEYAGKMNVYLSILDRIEKADDENRSIGIILCAEKDNVEVTLSLEDMGKPIGVADYHLIIPEDELKEAIVAEINSFEQEQSDRSSFDIISD